MKRTLKFSIVATVTGNPFETCWHSDDFDSACSSFADKLGEVEPSQPGDHDYFYCANESAIKETLPSAAIDALDGGERKEGFAQWAFERWNGDSVHGSAIWWATLSEAQYNGILDSRDFFDMLENVPAIFEDCETMGTLGGPLGGVVPDVAFTTEAQNLILSMRATPFLEDEDGNISPVSPASWERLKKFYADPWSVRN